MKRLEEERRIPVLPVFVDSPMAIERSPATPSGCTSSIPSCSRKRRDDKAPHGPADHDDPRSRAPASTRGTNASSASSAPSGSARSPRRRNRKELTASKMPAIVISSSGMATGGRVLHHLKAALPDPRNTVLFVGFPGRRHARTPAGRRRAGGQDPRADDSRPRAQSR